MVFRYRRSPSPSQSKRVGAPRHGEHLGSWLFPKYVLGKLDSVHAAAIHVHVSHQESNIFMASGNTQGFISITRRKDGIFFLERPPALRMVGRTRAALKTRRSPTEMLHASLKD